MKAAMLALLCTALTGCSVLSPTNSVAPAFYSLDAAAAAAPASSAASAPTLLIAPTRAAAGFDSPRIIYTREPHVIAYFAHSEWVDTPARMLGALLVTAMERNGAFRAVSVTSSAASGDVRLDTELVRLQHEFQTLPSQVRTRRVVASREIDSVVPSASQDPYGGVVAANAAVQRALQELSAFCVEALRQRPAVP